jgi:acetyl esterase/lipase
MLDDRTPRSQRAGDTDGVWDQQSNEFAWDAVLGHRRGGADVPPCAAAAREDTPGQLPPVYLDVGSAEILRAEAMEFAGRIWAAGGAAELHVWPGAYHGFDVIARDSQISKAAAAARLGWLQRLLARGGSAETVSGKCHVDG